MINRSFTLYSLERSFSINFNLPITHSQNTHARTYCCILRFRGLDLSFVPAGGHSMQLRGGFSSRILLGAVKEWKFRTMLQPKCKYIGLLSPNKLHKLQVGYAGQIRTQF
jgi:hypothetical protein